MYFRCKPALGLQFNSKMVKDIIKVFENNYEKKHFSLTLPKAFDYLMDVEKVASSTLKPLRLMYKLHKMSQGVAVIFVNKSEDQACVKKAMTADETLQLPPVPTIPMDKDRGSGTTAGFVSTP